jgi:hypothetical protein
VQDFAPAVARQSMYHAHVHHRNDPASVAFEAANFAGSGSARAIAWNLSRASSASASDLNAFSISMQQANGHAEGYNTHSVYYNYVVNITG